MQNCKICDSLCDIFFNEKILKKHNINYFFCENCGFLQTEKPFWLDEAYSDSIAVLDTGIMHRNIEISKKLSVILYFLFDKNKIYADFAGGYGILTRMMRDIGFNFFWADKYSENLCSRGFEYDFKTKLEAATCFEVFEHFVDPLHEIQAILKFTNTIIFSTELLPDIIPKPNDWWYYSFDTGQHISFYSKKHLYILQKN